MRSSRHSAPALVFPVIVVLFGSIFCASTQAEAQLPKDGTSTFPSSYSVDIASLPACPAPKPLRTQSGGLLGLKDPAAIHCYVDPIVAGEVGYNKAPILQHSPSVAYSGDGHPGAPPISGHPVTDAVGNTQAMALSSPSVSQIDTWQNGVTVTQSNLNFGGVGATLFAQQPNFGTAPASVLNWIGIQSSHQYNADFIQVGIESSNSSYYCDLANDTSPEVFFQVAIGGVYEQAQCLTNYIFGVATQTFFIIEWDPANSSWDAWINWNNVWELVNSLGPESVMVPVKGHAYPDLIAAEILLFGSGGAPNINNLDGGIADQQGQVYAAGSNGVFIWEWWFSDITTVVVNQGPYCVSFPVKYTNVTVSSC